jgi:hypothetical protein
VAGAPDPIEGGSAVVRRGDEGVAKATGVRGRRHIRQFRV